MASARFLTVEETAEVLNIGRTAAYAAAKKWRVTGGTEGIKVVVIGGSLRVPTPWLEELAGGTIDLEEIRAERAARKAEPEPDVHVDAKPKAPVLEVHTNPDPEPAPSRRTRTAQPAPQLDLFEPPAAS